MTVSSAIQSRLAGHAPEDGATPVGRLPTTLRKDPAARTGMLRRLSASPLFSLGGRSGALRAAQRRSGRPFRLDLRQRVIVKGLVSRHRGRGAGRAAALGAHIRYLARPGADRDGAPAEFFDRDRERLDGRERIQEWAQHRHHFRFIISPENGDRIRDMRAYVRDVMTRVSADLGEPALPWMAVCHYDTDQPHAHVLLPGRRADGRDLVIPRDYMAYGFRARAQEAAQERLGDLSRQDAERRVWRETTADRFTGFDRRLLAARDEALTVADGVGGHETWEALTRARLGHLESLGLAERVGRRFRLAPDMEARLRRLQTSRDIIRTLNQQRLARGADVRALGADRVRGKVVAAGRHDELGAAPWVVVRDAAGREHYARLGPGAVTPKWGTPVELAGAAAGPARLRSLASRSAESGL